MSKLIGLTGKAGSGKDFVFATMQNLWPRTRRIAFADGVREEVEDILKTDVVWDKPYAPEVRALLQWWGTDLRRAQDPNYWVAYAEPKIRRTLAAQRLTVVTDVRFANEAQAIRDLGGIIVEVVATDKTRKARLGGHLPPAHASEEIDFYVDVFVQNETRPVFPEVLNEYLGQPANFQPTVTEVVRALSGQ